MACDVRSNGSEPRAEKAIFGLESAARSSAPPRCRYRYVVSRYFTLGVNRSLRLAALTLIASSVVTGVASPNPTEVPGVSSREVKLAARASSALESLAGSRWSVTRGLLRGTRMVGFRWNSESEAAVAVRVRAEGRWGAWVSLHDDTDEGPDLTSPERRTGVATSPVWVGRAEDIQVQVVEGEVSNLTIIEVQPGSDRNGSWIARASATPIQPGIISRAEWGADESWRSYASGCNGSPSYASRLYLAFIHHTVNANSYGPDESDDYIRSIYHYHTHANGWCDIGYNFIIDAYGRIFEGRYGGLDKAVIGAHAGGFNTGSTGVALLGEFQNSGVPQASIDALHRLLPWKLMHHGVDAGADVTMVSGGSTAYSPGTAVRLRTISGHRDVSATTCPGQYLYAPISDWRRNVQRIEMSSSPYPLPGWTPVPGAPRLITVDGYGGLHPAGGEPQVPQSSFWNGWDIVRGAVAESDGGYVVDGWGALHEFGGAPPRSGSYWPGWDIVRGAAKGPMRHSGYVLDGWGGIHPYGLVLPVRSNSYWPGWDIARGIATIPSTPSGYLLDGWGGVHSFGGAPPVVTTGYWPGWDIARAIAVRPSGLGGWVLDGWGGLHPFGGAPHVNRTYYTPGRDTARAIIAASENGGWVMDADGALWPFGNAPEIRASLTWTGMGLGRAAIATP